MSDQSSETHFEHRPLEFVGVTTPTLIYIGIANREDFDRIALPCQDRGPTERGHVLVKSIGPFNGTSPTVIFQYWIKSLTLEGHRALDAVAKGAA